MGPYAAPSATLLALPPPDPLASARLLLDVARLIFRGRRAAARAGVLPAGAAAHGAAQLGQALAAAVEAAEQAEPGAARQRALAEVVRLGEQLAASIGTWESVEGLIGVLVEDLREQRAVLPRPPRRPGE